MTDAAIGVTRTESDEIELFFHAQQAKPKVLSASLHHTLREVLLGVEIIRDGQEEIFVFVGECEEALSEPDDLEDGADDHAPVDIDLTLEVLEVDRHRHVHCHHCHHVAVEVNFGGMAKHHRFSPATTIGVVTRWARKKFPNVDAAAAAEYVLQLCNSTEQPRSDEHLGELVDAPVCSICFDLVKEITPQGSSDEISRPAAF
jgi:hypothetical protein